MAETYDIVIRGGSVVDGTGAPAYRADVAIRDGMIAEMGDVTFGAADVIDAAGCLVTPGFVDIHTHYDGQITWSSRLEPSSSHGVTTVVTGNCGVGFAPCRPEDRDALLRLMEGMEDIPGVVMAAGIPWNWESFPDYLDSLSAKPFNIDVATQVPHAALRLFVVGERAQGKDPATEDDVRRMALLAREAIEAGVLGFSTSRLNHRSSDGTITPSYAAASDELAGIAAELGRADKGVLQLISGFEDIDAEFAIVRRMLEISGRPLSVSVLQMHNAPGRWRELLDRVERAADRDGLPIRGQVASRPVGILLGWSLARNPFIGTAAYREIEALDDGARLQALRDPDRREQILAQFPGDLTPSERWLFAAFDELYEYRDIASYEALPPDSITSRAAAANIDAPSFCYDLMTRDDGSAVLYRPSANYADYNTDAIRAMITSNHTVPGLSDGGAHCGLLCDVSLSTYLLKRWSTIPFFDRPTSNVNVMGRARSPRSPISPPKSNGSTSAAPSWASRDRSTSASRPSPSSMASQPTSRANMSISSASSPRRG